MRNFGFLVVFPRLDKSGSRSVTQVDAAARRVVEACRSNLPAAYQRHHKPIRQRAQFFCEVERKRGPAGPRAMEESHLVVETDALQRTGAFGHHHRVAQAQHRVDRVSWWPPRSRRELQFGRCHDLRQCPEANPRGIPFDSASASSAPVNSTSARRRGPRTRRGPTRRCPLSTRRCTRVPLTV